MSEHQESRSFFSTKRSPEFLRLLIGNVGTACATYVILGSSIICVRRATEAAEVDPVTMSMLAILSWMAFVLAAAGTAAWVSEILWPGSTSNHAPFRWRRMLASLLAGIAITSGYGSIFAILPRWAFLIVLPPLGGIAVFCLMRGGVVRSRNPVKP